MSYAVVCFLDEGEENAEVVQEVPIIWLRENNTVCLWPPTNSSYHIANETEPTVSWKQHPIRCERICDNLADARQRCLKETSSEDERGRGQRRKFMSKHLIGHKSKCLSPPLPEYKNHHPLGLQSDESSHQSSQQFYEDSEYSIQEIGVIAPQPVNPHYPLSPPKTQSSIHDNDFNEKHNREDQDQMKQNGNLKTIEKKIDKLFDLLGKIMLEIDALNKNQQRKQGPTIEPEYKQKFPFTSIQKLKDFDDTLNDNEQKQTLIKYFLSIGGLSAKDFHARLMTKMFTNTLAMTCSWKGFKNNHRVEKMTIILSMYEAIAQEFPVTLKEFEILTRDWLRHAKQRKLRE